MTKGQQRWRARGVEQIGGRLVVTVEDRHGDARRQPGELVKVHYRLGRWRFYADDARLTERLADGHARTLAATAARALARDHAPQRGADLDRETHDACDVCAQQRSEQEKTTSSGQLFV